MEPMSQIAAQQQDWTPFVAVSRVCMPPTWRLPHHVHEDYSQMLVLLSGVMEVAIHGQTIRAGAGEVLCYPAGVPHAERSAGRGTVDAIYLGFGGALNAIARSLPAHSRDAAGRVGVLARWMLERVPATSDAERVSLHSLLMAILAEHGAAPTEPDRQDLAARVRAYVRQHMAGPITLDDLAGAVGLSRYRFAHAFRDATGQPPMRFVQRLRVEAARGMLMTSDAPLRAIAQVTGFADQFHLSKTFRQLVGSCPSALRRR